MDNTTQDNTNINNINVPLAFDIDFKENNLNKTPVKSLKAKERLEQRRIQNLNSNEKMKMEMVEEKLAKANEKRSNAMRNLTNVLSEKNQMKMKAFNEYKMQFEQKTMSLKTKLNMNLDKAEERRHANIQNRLNKVQNDLEKVKQAKQRN